MSVISYIKEHPAKVAVGVFVIGILYLLLRHRSGTTVVAGSTGPTPDDVQSATAIQVAQIQAQTQTNQTNAAAQVASQNIGAEVAIANLQANYQTNNATLQNDTARILAGFQAQTTQLVSTLQAQVANTQTSANVAINKQNTDALVTVATAPYNAQLLLAQNQAALEATQITSLRTVITNALPAFPSDTILQGQATRDNFAGHDQAYLAAVQSLSAAIH